MTILTLKSPAKVNLTLDVLEPAHTAGKREPSGYHRIQTIFHEVPKLYDTLIFEEVSESLPLLKSKVWIEYHGLGACHRLKIPTDESNTILRAARLLQETYGVKDKGMRIILEKRIPPQSGLGGAASNAATTLRTLNALWGLNLPIEKLLTHAAQIGMDVPFFILGGCALGMHYGEHLMPLPTLDTLGLAIEIIPTKTAVSTPQAYAALDLSHCGQCAKDTGELVKILKGEKVIEDKKALEFTVKNLLHNDFESSFFSTNPNLKKQYQNAHLTGSGGTLFRLLSKTPASLPAHS